MVTFKALNGDTSTTVGITATLTSEIMTFSDKKQKHTKLIRFGIYLLHYTY